MQHFEAISRDVNSAQWRWWKIDERRGEVSFLLCCSCVSALEWILVGLMEHSALIPWLEEVGEISFPLYCGAVFAFVLGTHLCLCLAGISCWFRKTVSMDGVVLSKLHSYNTELKFTLCDSPPESRELKGSSRVSKTLILFLGYSSQG